MNYSRNGFMNRERDTAHGADDTNSSVLLATTNHTTNTMSISLPLPLLCDEHTQYVI